MKHKRSAFILSLLMCLATKAGALVVHTESTEAQFTAGTHNSTYITGTGSNVNLGLDYYGHSAGLSAPGSDEWFNPDWKYRQPLSLNSSYPGTLTNYPVQFTLNTQAVIADGRMNADGSDIRFTTAALTGSAPSLAYYIVPGSINTTATKIWVKLPSIAAGAGTIYLYSGNASAAAASSMASTFVLGDNFTAVNGVAPSTATWGNIESVAPVSGSVADIQTGQLRLHFGSTLNTQYYGLRSANQYSFAAGRRYHADINARTSGTDSYSSFTLCKTVYNYSYDEANWLRFSIKHSGAGATYALERKYFGTKTTLASGNVGNGFHGVDYYIGASTFSVMLDGAEIYNAANNTVSITNPYIYLEATSDSATLQDFLFDNLSVQPFSSPEPVYDSPGPEQGRRYPSGSFVSQIKDSAALGTKYQYLDWTAVTPSSASLSFEVRAHDTDVVLGTFTATSKQGNPAISGRYVQYRLNLSTLDPRYTATVSSASLTYGSPPLAPAGAAANTISQSAINWRWTDNSSGQYEEEGFRVLDSTTSEIKGSVTAGTTFWIETSLTPNTQYTRSIVGYNTAGVGLPSQVSRYTLAASPYVSCDKSTGTWLSGALTCLNMAGFGSNGVGYYRYVWTQNPVKSSWLGNESQWTSGTLINTANLSGDWYLHVKSYNGEDAISVGQQTYGPYWYDKALPTVTSIIPSSSPWSSLAANPVVSLSDTGGAKLSRVRHNWSASPSRPFTGDGSWQAWYYTNITGNDTATYTTSKGTAGQWYLHIEVEDTAGNLGYLASGSSGNAYKIDMTNPTGSVTINGGAGTTATREVTLSLTYADTESGVKEVAYVNDVNNANNYTVPELARATTGWTLSAGDGVKRVYYRVTDNAGRNYYPYDEINLVSSTTLLGSPRVATTSGVMGEAPEIFSARAVLTWAPDESPLNDKPISFYFQGSTLTALTNSLGVATTDFFVPTASGTYVYGVEFFPDGVYSGSTSTGVLTATQRPTTLISEDVNGTSNTPFVAKAILKDLYGSLIIGATVTFTFEGMTATATTSGIGVATVTFTAPIPVAFYDYTATYAGGPVYAANSAIGRLGVGLKVTSLIVPGVTGPAQADFNVQATLMDGVTPVEGSTITFVFLNTTWTAITNSFGVATSSFAAPNSSGTYNYSAFFYGDEIYAPSSGGATLTVSRRSASLAGDNLIGYVNSSFQARAVLSDGVVKVAGKPIVFVFETSSATVLTDINGVSTAVFNSGSLPRTSTCYYYFEGDAGYLFADSTNTVTIDRRPVALAASDITSPLSSSFTATVELKDIAFTPTVLQGKTINFSFLGEPKTAVTNSLGIATVTYQTGVSTGSYDFYASFDQDEVYLAGNDTGTVTMSKRLVAITANLAYNFTLDPIKPVVTLKDSITNEFISSKTIVFTYGGVAQSTTTGSSGGALGKAYAIYPSTGYAGIYPYYADFPGNTLYAANSSTSSITVSSRAVNLSAFPQTIILGSTFTVTAEFRDGLTNALVVNKPLKLVFFSSTVFTQTDSSGVATTSFNSPASTGAFNWLAEFAGDKTYVKASSTGTITVSRRAPSLTPLAANKFVWDSIYLSATFFDDSTPLQGKNIDFYFQGATRTVQTDASGTTGVFGTAFSSVSVPGIYTYSVAFPGDTTYSAQTGSATLTVSARPSNLSLGPITAIANSTVALTATLIDSNNGARIMSGKSVSFTLDGSSYGITALTDSLGVARAVYNSSSAIKVSSFSATFYGNTNYGPSTSTNSLTVTLRPSVLEMSDYYPAAASSFTAYSVLKDYTTGVKIATRTVSYLFSGLTKTAGTDGVGYSSVTYYAVNSTATVAISATFAGPDALYAPSTINKVVYPGRRNTVLITSDMLGAVAKDTFTVTARLKDFDLDANLPGLSVKFDFNGLPSSTTITGADGVARAVFTAPTSTGNYTYTATFLATPLYNGYTNTSAVLVNRRTPVIEPADLTGIAALSTFTVSSLMRDGAITLSTRTLSFYFASNTPNTKTAITNNIGVASTTFQSPLSTGTFSYSVSFAGDGLYLPGSANGSVGVVLKRTMLEVLDEPDAVVGLPFTGTAKLRDIDMSNALVTATKTVTLTFTTGTVNSITSVGVATASFTAPPTVGTYDYTATFAGDSMYGSSQSTGTVTVKKRPVIFSVAVPAGEPYTLSTMTVKGTLVDGKTGEPLAFQTIKIFFSIAGTTNTVVTDAVGIATTTFSSGIASGTYMYSGYFAGNGSYNASEVNEQTLTSIKINARPTSLQPFSGDGMMMTWGVYTFNGFNANAYILDNLNGNSGIAGLTLDFLVQGSTITGVSLADPPGRATSSTSFPSIATAGSYPVQVTFAGNQTYAPSILPGGVDQSAGKRGFVPVYQSPANISMDAIQESFPNEDKIISGVAHDGYLGDRGNARPVLKGLQVRYRISDTACSPYPSNCPWGTLGTPAYGNVNDSYIATATVHSPVAIGDYPIERWFATTSSFYYWEVTEDKRVLRVGLRPTDLDVATSDPLEVGANMPIVIKVKLKSTSQADLGVAGQTVRITFSGTGTYQDIVTVSGGIAQATFSGQAVGDYTYTATYAGDTAYNSCVLSPVGNVHVVKNTTVLTGTPVTLVPAGNNFVAKATVMVNKPDLTTEPAPGRTINFTFPGVANQDATTNASGIAQVTFASPKVPQNTAFTATLVENASDFGSVCGGGTCNVQVVLRRTSLTSVAKDPLYIQDSFTSTATLVDLDAPLNLPSALNLAELVGQTINFTLHRAPDGDTSGTGLTIASPLGQATRLFTPPNTPNVSGSKSYTAAYTSDGLFASVTAADASINVLKRPTNLSASIEPTTPTNSIFTATVTLKDITPTLPAPLVMGTGNNVPVKFVYNGVTNYGTTNNSGIATATFTAHSAFGDYNCEITYEGNTTFGVTTLTLPIHVIRRITQIAGANVSNQAAGAPFTAQATLQDFTSGAGIDASHIDFVFTGAGGATFSDFGTTNPSGYTSAVFTAPLTTGTYNYTACFPGDSTYDAKCDNINTVSVDVSTASLSMPDRTTLVNSVFFATATLKGQASGQGLSGKPVSFTYVGVLKGTPNTGIGGTAVQSFTPLSTGTYQLDLSFAGDPAFYATASSTTITVDRRTSGIVIDGGVGSVGAVFRATATLSDLSTNPSSPASGGRRVDFVFNGTVTSSATANALGVATTSFTAPLTSGSYPITANHPGDAIYKPSNTPSANIVVDKRPTQLTVLSNTATALEVFTATATLKWNGTGLPTKTVRFTYKGVDIDDATDGSGYAYAEFSAGASSGPWQVTAAFLDGTDVTYDVSSGTNTVTVQRRNCLVVPDIITMSVYDNFKATVTFTDMNGSSTPAGKYAKVAFTQSWSPSTGTTSATNGSGKAYLATFQAPATAGTYQVQSWFAGDYTYNPSISSASAVYVSKRSTVLSIANVDTMIGRIFTATATLTDTGGTLLNTQNVLFSFEGKTFNVPTGVSGSGIAVATFTVTISTGGTQITATYAGDANSYLASSPSPSTATVTAAMRPTSVANYSATAIRNMVFKATATVRDIDNQFVTGLPVGLTFNGITLTTNTNTIGVSTAAYLANVSTGPWPVWLNFPGNFKYAASSTTVNVTVQRRTTSILPLSSNITVSALDVFYATATLRDMDLTPITTGKPVYYVFTSSSFARTTDGAGVAVSTYAAPPANGVYTATVYFDGDANYEPSSAPITVTVQKRLAGITINPVTAKALDTFKSTATLTDLGNGLLKVSTRPVTFTFSFGGSPSANTNGTGVSTVSFTAPATANTYTITASFPGDVTYASTTTVIDFPVLKRDGVVTGVYISTRVLDLFTAVGTFKDSVTNANTSGRAMKFGLHDNLTSTKTFTTDSSGVYSVDFNAPAASGTYKLAIWADADATYNASNVYLSSVTANRRNSFITLTGPTAAIIGSSFTAGGTMYDSVSGAFAASRPISFLFQGNTAPATTNASGSTSTVYTASLSSGIYALQASFAGDSTYNSTVAVRNINMLRYPSRLSGTPVTVIMDEVLTATATLTNYLFVAAPGQNLNFTFNGIPQTPPVTDAQGKAYAPYSSVGIASGTYQLPVTYLGDSQYDSTNTLIPVMVDRRTALLPNDPTAVNALNIFTASATLTDSRNTSLKLNNQTVVFEFLVGGSTFINSGVSNVNGLVTSTFTAPVSSGTYQIRTTFAGNATYYPLITFGAVTVSPRPSRLMQDNSIGTIDELFRTTATLVDVQTSLPVYPKSIAFTFGASSSAVNGSNGKASVAYTAPSSSGAFPMSSLFSADATYAAWPSTGTLTVLRRPVTMVAANISGIIDEVFNADVVFADKLSGGNIYGSTISFVFNSKTFLAQSAAITGIAHSTFTAPAPGGVYYADINFAGSPRYLPNNTTVQITVDRRPSEILPDLVVTRVGNVFTATATLRDTLDISSHPVNRELVFFFANNNSSFTVFTDSLGVAVSTFMAASSSGTFALGISFAGDARYQPAAVSTGVSVLQRESRITINPITISAMDDFTANAILSDRAIPSVFPVGREIIFGFDGLEWKNFISVTDIDGIAVSTFAGPVSSGSYLLQGVFEGDSVYEATATVISVIVLQRAAGITVTDQSAYPLESFTAAGALKDTNTQNPIIGRSLNFLLDGVGANGLTDAVGVATAAYTPPAAFGSYEMDASFAGDATYAAVPFSSGTVVVLQRPTDIAALDATTTALEVFTASVTLSDVRFTSVIPGLSVIFSFEGKASTGTTDAFGVVTATFAAPVSSGTYYYEARSTGTSVYAMTYTTGAVTVGTRLTRVIARDTNANVGEPYILKGQVIDPAIAEGAPGYFVPNVVVQFRIKDKNNVPVDNGWAITNELGIATQTFSGPGAPDVYFYNAAFEGNYTYSASSASAMVKVGLLTSIVAFDVETVALETFTGKAKLTDYLSTTLDGKPIRFTFMGSNNSGLTTADGNSGVASATFTALSSSGTYIYNAYFDGDSIYSASNATATVVIKLRPSGILVYPAAALAYSSFTASIQLGNILDPYASIAGRNVDIAYRGSTITAVTDGDGIANALFFASASSGTFNFSATFSGDETYAPSVRVGTVTVTRRPINMLTYNVADATANSTFTAKVQMKDNGGNPIAGLGVTFDFDGNTDIGTTDGDGFARVVFTAPSSSGTYNYTAVFYQDDLYSGANNFGVVTVGPRPTLVFTAATSAMLGSPQKLSARLVDVSNQAGIPGETLSFYFEGSTLSALTDNLGVSTVTFNLPLSTGAYYFEAAFNGNGITYSASGSSAPLTVAENMTSLTAKTPISLKILEPLLVDATLSGPTGLPLAGLPIVFTFEGSSTTSITANVTGKATATFSTEGLPSTGTYNYSADYPGDTLYMASSDTSNVVTVYRRDSLLIARDAQAVPSKTFIAEARFYDNVNGSALMNMPLAGKAVAFSLYFSTFTQVINAVTSDLGVSTVSFLAPVSTGSYVLTARFADGDPIYLSALSSATLTVLLDDGTGAIKTKLKIENVTSYISKQSVATQFVASGTLTATELPITGKYVLFEFFDGVSTTNSLGFTDGVGLATAAFTAPISSGIYIITASFATGDPNYASTTGTGTLTANRYPDSLAAQAVAAFGGETFRAKAVLSDDLSLAFLTGRTVTFSFFNGVSTITQNAVTSSTGSAEINLTAPTIPGNYSYKALFAGSTEYLDSQDTAAVLIAAKGSNTFLRGYDVFIGTGEVFAASSTLMSGAAYPVQGKLISITFNGTLLLSTTNAQGLASAEFTAPVSSGMYICTASFLGDPTYNATTSTAAVYVVFRKQPEQPPVKVEVTSTAVTLAWTQVTVTNADVSDYVIEETALLRGVMTSSVTVSSSTLGYSYPVDENKTTYLKVKTKLTDNQNSDDSIKTSLIVEIPGKLEDPERVPNYYYMSKDEGANNWAAWIKIPGKVMDKVSTGGGFSIDVTKKETPGFLAGYTVKANGASNETLEKDMKSSDKKGVKLTISYPKSGTGTSAASGQLAIFWFNGVEWVKIGGEIDVLTGEIYTYSRVLGEFAIRAAPLASTFTLNKVAPRIFSPDVPGTTEPRINRVRFYFENPDAGEVTIRIFDITGALVRRNLESEGSSIMFWNGKNQSGALVKGGIYIYQLEAGDEVLTGTVVVAK